MTPKPYPTAAKASSPKDRKVRKGTTDTSRLFIHVDEVLRRPATISLSRYVE